MLYKLEHLIKFPIRYGRSLFWQIFYGFPSKKIKLIFVTGTDGKTTTSNFIFHILNSLGKKAGIISTVYAFDGKKDYETGFHVTTPGPKLLNKLLKEMVINKCEYAVIEVTSHAIDQYKVLSLFAEVSIITNVTHEHLDYHKTYVNYLNTKAKLIDQSNYIVINGNDISTAILTKKLNKKNKIYSMFYEKDVEAFLSKDWKNRFPGIYNLQNAAAAIQCLKFLGINKEDSIKALNSYDHIEGRFDVIHKPNSSYPFTIIVDFAHTPNALEKILNSVKTEENRVIVVFGSAGERDKSKRPLMGEVVSRIADIGVITLEDPRSEKVEFISKDIEKGFLKNEKELNKDYFLISNRKDAINFALNTLAKEGDVILLTGKGHEKTLNIGGKEIPWSDKEVALELLKEKVRV